MPIMTDGIGDDGQPAQVIDERFVDITYEQIAQTGDGADITGLTVASGASVGEYLLVEYGNDDILTAHPDWAWRGTYEWSDGTEGAFSGEKHTVYDSDGTTSKQVYGIPFTVTSQEIRDGESKSVAIANSYSRETVTLTAQKRWASPSGSAIAWPLGKSVTFQLGRLNGDNEFVANPLIASVTLDNQKDSSGEEVAGSAVFKNLPKYLVENGNKVLIRYAVREYPTVSGYNVVYPAEGQAYAAFDSASTVTIKNQLESTQIKVSKEWANAIPDTASATFRLYSYTGSDASSAAWVSNVNDIVLDGVVDSGEGTFGEREAWKASFTGLPKYTVGNQELHYLVKEIACVPSNYESDVEYAANGGKIKNAIATTTFLVTKEWRETANNAWPGDETITLTLRREGDDGFSQVYTLAKNGIDAPAVHEGVTWDGSKLTVAGLQKYKTDGTAWRYYATEADMSEAGFATTYHDKNGYVVSAGKAYSGGSVRNTLSSKSLTVSKTVAGNMGDRDRGFSFRVVLRKSDGTAYTGSMAFEKTSGGETTTGSQVFGTSGATVSLKHGEQIAFVNLPGGLSYTVSETPEDYAVSMSVNGGDAVVGSEVSGTLSSDVSVAFTNTRNVLVPTGVRTSWYALALIPVFAGIAWAVRRNREA